MALSWDEIRDNAFKFSKKFENSTSEKSDAPKFVSDFLEVFGVDSYKVGKHEYKVKKKAVDKGYMDYLWPGVIAIEMKSAGQDLNKAYEQLEGYVAHLNKENLPELLMVSDLQNIWVSHRTKKHQAKFTTKELCDFVNEFEILAGKEETKKYEKQEQVNIKASEKMAKLHKAMKDAGYEGHKLQVYLVRLLFCLFADDSGIFHKNIFLSYIENSKEDGSDLAGRLNILFDILNMPEEERQKQTVLQKSSPDLFNFPYVNGGLFAEVLRTPAFDARMRQTLIDACHFNWKSISPAIFGAMFQGVMDEKERHDLGAHYTSEENILKVIKPLFLDDLWEEFHKVKNLPKRLEAFHKKLSSLKFLDPACGCGNFLIVAYKELRELEIEVIKITKNRMLALVDTDYISKVRVSQFYGIEIEEFPCQVAQVSMWLVQHLMNLKLREFAETKPSVPLVDKANIVCGNALTMDWNEVVPSSELTYIFGNPPFIGRRYRNKEQIKDVAQYFEYKDIDYVCCWFKKAYHAMLQNKAIKTAFVATNSISQGEQVQALWNELTDSGIVINYAYRTFKWSNEAKGKAAVHCVIIGYSFYNNTKKIIYDESGNSTAARNINGYLIDAPNVYINIRSKPICDVPQMKNGNVPLDGDALKIEVDDIDKFENFKYIKRLIGGRELLHNEKRYVLWLVDASPDEIKSNKEVLKRVELCRKNRLAMKDKGTQKLADKPTTFRDTNNPEFYIALPMVSSEKRTYLPMCYFDKETIPTNQIQIITDANHYHFGVLSSIVHMAWMKAIAGRLEMRYRYSKDIVYNNFPWVENASDQQRTKIAELAQNVLDARALYPTNSLADLYDPWTMPENLRKAHNALDREVMKLYGYSKDATEDEIVADLLNRYERLIEQEKLEQANKKTTKKKKA